MRPKLHSIVGSSCLGLALALAGACGMGQVFFDPPASLFSAGSTGTGGRPAGNTSGGGATSGGSGITVSTLAGNGVFGDRDGSGGRNGTAELGWPMGVAVDAAGNVFVADNKDSKIRKIDPQGNVTTWAGNGIPGDIDGTGGPNGKAELDAPVGLALGPSGDLFVADSFNKIVRAIDALGDVITLPIQESAGIPFGYVGAVAVGPSGTIYVADTDNQRICAISPGGYVQTLAGNMVAGYTDGDPALAQFDNPYGLAVDQFENVFVGDSENNVIRKIDGISGTVTTLAGNGVAGYADGPPGLAEFSLPSGLALDPKGNLIVADCSNNRIRSVDPSGNVTTLAGNGRTGDADGSGGPNGVAEFNCPFGVAVDTGGTIYVGGNDDFRVRTISGRP